VLIVEDDVPISEAQHTELALMLTQTEPSQPTQADSLVHLLLSSQALAGSPSPQTLKFQGSTVGHPIMVLVDSGSSYNIIQTCFTSHLKLAMTHIPQF